MDSHQIAQLLGILAVVLAAARLLGTRPARSANRPCWANCWQAFSWGLPSWD